MCPGVLTCARQVEAVLWRSGLIWLKFIGLSLVIIVAGTKAAQYADVIAERTGLGRIRVGLLLLAVISSMPELVAGVSSVGLVKAPDLGVGTLLGSTLFNLTILALLDISHRGGPVLNRASMRHLPLAGMGILLMVGAGTSIHFSDNLDGVVLGWLGVPTIIIMVVYLAGLWAITRWEGNQHRAAPPPSVPEPMGHPRIWPVWLKLGIAACAIIAAGTFVSYVADEIADVTGWGTSFVGSLLLAIVTSLPELVIAIAALRMGAIDLAVADILGANMLDIAHLFTLDLFHTEGPLLSAVSGAHVTTAVLVVSMTAIVAAALRFRQRRKTFSVISWYAVLLLGLYFFGAYALFSSELGL